MRAAGVLMVGAAAAALAVVAACGGGTGASAPTVSAREVPGAGTALVDAGGRTLYFADQEADGTIRCVGDCLSVWVPLTVSTGTIPTAGTGVGGTLATVARPDGGNQVTYDGRPLYTFAPDGGAGRSGGNGVRDRFGTTDFLWHAAPASGSAPAPPAGDGGPGGY
jgi:predicted lipoprotein with Yx(FWY)xxD motif